MKIRGALHVHSNLSHDGTLTISELTAWYRQRNYQFIALGEHAQDFDGRSLGVLVSDCARCSTSDFCVIPGLEFACQGGLHIVGLGMTALLEETEPVAVIRAIQAHYAFAVLAHPERNGWKCSPEVVQAADAAEIWNVAYDGKFLPSPASLRGFPRMRGINPQLLAVVGHDFHRKAGFYDVAVEMEIRSLSGTAILNALRHGMYTIQSRFFHARPQGEFSHWASARLLMCSWPLSQIRGARDLVRRLSS